MYNGCNEHIDSYDLEIIKSNSLMSHGMMIWNLELGVSAFSVESNGNFTPIFLALWFYPHG